MRKIALFLGIIGTFIFSCNSRNEEIVHVIDLVKVFNGYQLKIDMEEADSMSLNKKVHQIDSIKATIELRKNEYNPQEFQAIMYQLDLSFEEAFQKSNERINEAVWKSINVLVKEFGKKHNYKLIVGANSMGSVMYYTEEVDVTNDLIMFINDNYEQKK